MRAFRSAAITAVSVLGLLSQSPRAGADVVPGRPASATMPITTSSEEARQLYLQGRDLFEKLRATDARALFAQAAAKDPEFALAQVGLANTSGTAKEFFAAAERAAALSAHVSEPERLWILGLQAGAKGDVAGQRTSFTKLARLLPQDERAHNLLAAFLFAQQDFPGSVAEYEKATAINPDFTQPYNQLGYAYRFMGRMPEAERAFKKYIELIPGDPNPYDSYAELLMKMGRFSDSIANYEKALAVDPNFINSYVGIANNHIFQGQGEQARAALARIDPVARNNGERVLARFWTAISFVHEGATDKALAEVEKMDALARADNDGAALSGNAILKGNILLNAGRADEALAQFKASVAAMDAANVPAEVKTATHRNTLYNESRVLLAKKDVAGAKALAADYTRQVDAKAIPFEVRQRHELDGLVALAEGRSAAAVAALQQANQQDPQVLYLLAVAFQGAGDAKKAHELGARAADWNSLFGNYAYVRAKAKDLVSKS